jgi:phosphoribosylanthranilate isomerase
LATGPLDLEAIRCVVQPWKSGEFPLLLDADAGAHGGGLGLRLDWKTIGRWSMAEGFSENLSHLVGSESVRWALAGGLTPETVGQAIAASHANSIDVASGVEEPRGQKSRHKIQIFVNAALAAWGCPRPA